MALLLVGGGAGGQHQEWGAGVPTKTEGFTQWAGISKPRTRHSGKQRALGAAVVLLFPLDTEALAMSDVGAFSVSPQIWCSHSVL